MGCEKKAFKAIYNEIWCHSGYISVNSKLIDNPNGFTEWDNHALIISFEKLEYITKLWDVPFPYYLSKKQNSDTLVVQKDRLRLYFRMDTSD